MHGPTCIFWADLKLFSLKVAAAAREAETQRETVTIPEDCVASFIGKKGSALYKLQQVCWRQRSHHFHADL
jgi:hypothetical protein